VTKACAGDFVGIMFSCNRYRRTSKGKSKYQLISGDESKNNTTKIMIAQISVLNHPGIKKYYSPKFCSNLEHIGIIFEKLITKIDETSGEILEEGPEIIKTGDCAIV
jgi:translation elongation factor EF-1alpha